ncbi:hypothetical protein [Paenibacillus sp.]|uniref:hypothetical protein n=1 Tax=Paenibacillus sp. TaxID=58172 RepID=UPI0028A75196|nr:hypothetical protein [Paenibacillus sp.]
MKKFISGIIVGALLFTGASVFADSASLIGQKVQGIFVIEKSGTKVAEAVVINGTAYAPVRAVSEAAGTKLTVEGKKIIMDETVIASTGETITERDHIVSEIARYDKQISGYKADILPTYKLQAEELANNGDLGKRAAETYADFKAQVDAWEMERAALQAQLAAIDGNK